MQLEQAAARKAEELAELKARLGAEIKAIQHKMEEVQRGRDRAEEQLERHRQQLERGLNSVSATANGEAVWKGKYQELKREFLAYKQQRRL